MNRSIAAFAFLLISPSLALALDQSDLGAGAQADDAQATEPARHIRPRPSLLRTHLSGLDEATSSARTQTSASTTEAPRPGRHEGRDRFDHKSPKAARNRFRQQEPRERDEHSRRFGRQEEPQGATTEPNEGTTGPGANDGAPQPAAGGGGGQASGGGNASGASGAFGGPAPRGGGAAIGPINDDGGQGAASPPPRGGGDDNASQTAQDRRDGQWGQQASDDRRQAGQNPGDTGGSNAHWNPNGGGQPPQGAAPSHGHR